MRLTAENTALVVDSTADFPDAPKRFANWRVVPLYVRFGDESYRDYVELGPDEFYVRLRTAPELPTTSQPTPADFAAVYNELSGYQRVYSVHISSKLSGTFESARTAAAEHGDRVRTIDSTTASAAVAMLGLAIQRRLGEGTTDEEIDALVQRYRRDAGLLFTVDTLEFLRRGGRIGRAAAMAGQVLNVKPILTIRDGEVIPLQRVRGWKKASAEFQRIFLESVSDAPGLRVGIAHADAPERARELEHAVRSLAMSVDVELVTTLGAVVGTHAGPGTIGFFWFQDS